MIVVILILSFFMPNVSSLNHHYQQQHHHRYHRYHHCQLPQSRSIHLQLFKIDSNSKSTSEKSKRENVSTLVSRKPNANKKKSLLPPSPVDSPQPSSSVKNIFSNFFSDDIRFTRIEKDIKDIEKNIKDIEKNIKDTKNDFKIGLGIVVVFGGIRLSLLS